MSSRIDKLITKRVAEFVLIQKIRVPLYGFPPLNVQASSKILSEMSLMEMMKKVSASRFSVMAVLAICLGFAQNARSQTSEMKEYLLPDPDAMLYVDMGQMAELGQMLSSVIPGGEVESSSLTGVIFKGKNVKTDKSLLTGYDISQFLKDFDFEGLFAGQEPADLDIDFLIVETLSSEISQDDLDDSTQNFEVRSHEGVDYFYAGDAGPEFVQMLGASGSFWMPDMQTIIAGPESAVQKAIDNSGKESSDSKGLGALIESEMSMYVVLRAPEGMLAELLDSSEISPLMKPLLVGFTEMNNLLIGVDTSGDSFDIKVKLQFPDADSTGTLEGQLNALLTSFASAEGEGPENPQDNFLKQLNVSSSGDTLSIATSFPKQMVQALVAGMGAPGGPGFGGPQMPLPDDISLVDRSSVRGKVIDPIEEGVIIDLADGGGFSRRYHWSEMDIPTLEKFNQIPQTRRFVQYYIPKERPGVKTISLSEPKEVVNPAEGGGFLGALFTTPAGIGLLLLIYLGNIWAAIEVAAFRSHPVALVAGAAAIMPIISPIIFYFIPTQTEYSPSYADEGEFMDGDEVPDAEEAPKEPTQGIGAPKGFVMPEPEGGGLSLSAGAAKSSKPSGELQPGQRRIYKRGEVDITRGFIEQNFVPFFRTVVSGAEANQVIDFKTPRQTLTARRISRISPNEVYVQLQSGGPNEKGVKIAEIAEIIVRHKDDRG